MLYMTETNSETGEVTRYASDFYLYNDHAANFSRALGQLGFSGNIAIEEID